MARIAATTQLNVKDGPKLVTVEEASKYVTKKFNKKIEKTNVSHLFQYGRIKQYKSKNKTIHVDLTELVNYYNDFFTKREQKWREVLGDDINWDLSFETMREKDTTKHVHRLHQYKGKFIPQLVEYFLDDTYFKKGDIVLDPFMGSGTTLIQSKEMGINSIGVDISKFNCMIAGSKLENYDLELLQQNIDEIRKKFDKYRINEFENELNDKFKEINLKYFPKKSRKHHSGDEPDIKKITISAKKTFKDILNKHNVKNTNYGNETFLDKWYIMNVRKEIDFLNKKIQKISDRKIKTLLKIILSRTIRSCRATTHYDLGTLKEPQLTPYYCDKHGKICKPLFSVNSRFSRYCDDTIKRITEYSTLKTDVDSIVLNGNSKSINFDQQLKHTNIYSTFKSNKIKGIFTSPPYVGQINYHEQHAYSYELYNIDRHDKEEIGSLKSGKNIMARKSYIKEISDVLKNCRKYMNEDCDVFVVANDTFNLYPEIIELSGMRMVQKFKRPVLNRVERNIKPYAEFIFHLKG